MTSEEIKYQEAKKKVAALRGFYVHFTVYLVCNLFLFLLNITLTPETLWFIWPLLGWTIAIMAHALSVFGPLRLFGSEWEQKKISEIMEKE